MSVKFWIKKKVSDESLIMVTYVFNYRRIRVSTGIKIKPRYWIASTKSRQGRAVNNFDFKGDEVNVRLNNIGSPSGKNA